MSITEQLLAQIEAFMVRHEMSATSFGMQVCRDPHLVRWLRAGHGITTRRYERIVQFMSEGDAPNTPRRRRPRSGNVRAAA